MRITFISDTHTKHKIIEPLLIGGDLLIHAGDFMSSGYNPGEAESFFSWYDSINNYETKILISGNHDRIMENDPPWASGILTGYKTIEYLQDDGLTLYFDGPNGEFPEDNIHIWGSPWQPEFNNWAFNLQRGEEIKKKWDLIPQNTDILITHGPPFGKLDYVPRGGVNVGCEELLKKVQSVRPKIHVFGHIHEGAGYVFDGSTHFINAAVLNDRYEFRNRPLTIDWDSETNEIEFV
jgi:Icc-related predicted phosphoesterase